MWLLWTARTSPATWACTAARSCCSYLAELQPHFKLKIFRDSATEWEEGHPSYLFVLYTVKVAMVNPQDAVGSSKCTLVASFSPLGSPPHRSGSTLFSSTSEIHFDILTFLLRMFSELMEAGFYVTTRCSICRRWFCIMSNDNKCIEGAPCGPQCPKVP